MATESVSSLRVGLRSSGPFIGALSSIGALISDILAPFLKLSPFIFFFFLFSTCSSYLISRNFIKTHGFASYIEKISGKLFLLQIGMLIIFAILSIVQIAGPEKGYIRTGIHLLDQLEKRSSQINQESENLVFELQKTEESLIELQKKVSSLAQSGQLISNPSSAAEFYHNARVSLLMNNRKIAKESLESFFNFYPDFLDVHEMYQNIIIPSLGKEESLGIYNELIKQFPESPTISLIKTRLLSNYEEKKSALYSLLEKNTDFAPIHLELVLLILEQGYGKIFKTEYKEYHEHLKKWQQYESLGKVQSHYFDLSYLNQFQDKLNEAETMYDNFGKVSIDKVLPGEQNLELFRFWIKENEISFHPQDQKITKIFYRFLDNQNYSEMELESHEFPGLDRPLPKRCFVLKETPYSSSECQVLALKDGQHTISLKYQRLDQRVSPPFKKHFKIKNGIFYE